MFQRFNLRYCQQNRSPLSKLARTQISTHLIAKLVRSGMMQVYFQMYFTARASRFNARRPQKEIQLVNLKNYGRKFTNKAATVTQPFKLADSLRVT
jgi:hypothetical protein